MIFIIQSPIINIVDASIVTTIIVIGFMYIIYKKVV